MGLSRTPVSKFLYGYSMALQIDVSLPFSLSSGTLTARYRHQVFTYPLFANCQKQQKLSTFKEIKSSSVELRYFFAYKIGEDFEDFEDFYRGGLLKSSARPKKFKHSLTYCMMDTYTHART
jgi:hypothetical protein